LRKARLIDTENILARNHQLDQFECEQLALIETADGVRSHRDGLHALELQTKFACHDFAHAFKSQFSVTDSSRLLENLFNTRDSSIQLSKLHDCTVHNSHLINPLTLSALLFIDLLKGFR